MRILIAPDKFKGSLTASEAALRIAEGWREVFPGDKLTLRPVADGGDGTLAAVACCGHGEWVSCHAVDARGCSREVRYWRQGDDVWIESAAVCGLAELPSHKRNPLKATTAGLAEVLLHARSGGARRIFLCLGGSATNDGGCGMAAALGFRFFDGCGTCLDPRPCELHRLERIERPAQPFALPVTGLTDVQNPLLGHSGASHVYGPQKGALPDDVVRLEEVLARMARIAVRDLDASSPETPGAGAAGGLGFGIMTFLGGSLRGGFEVIAEVIGLPDAVKSADLVLTGEGRIDEQTAFGKAPAGVVGLARKYGKGVVAFAGSASIAGCGIFDAIIPIANEPMSLNDAMKNAGPLLRHASERTARAIRLGRIL